MNKPAALDSLRAIFRATRAGSAVDAQALVAAIGEAVSAGADVTAAKDAFFPYALIFVSNLGGTDGAFMVRSALATGGMRAALRMASLLGWTDVWSAAMTAHYGPTHTHESRRGADGRPTAETLAEFPELAHRMVAASEQVERLLGWYERFLPATRWEHVVTMRAA